MPDIRRQRLERSCKGLPGGWIKLAHPQSGIERAEAFFAGHGFEPHRHDTYAIGLTLAGVQSFGYRGATRHSLPGQSVVLHPDELHDGRAGTDDGFRYRIAYIAPRLIQQALGGTGRPLPFVSDAVSDDPQLKSSIAPILEDLDAPLDALEIDEASLDIATALARLDQSDRRAAVESISDRVVASARAFLDAAPGRAVTSEELEALSGLSRFSLARHFRACLGTSPYRYLTMRRLDGARRRMLAGMPLAEAAAECGFADQSHMTRQFKRAYGVTPGGWLRLIRQAS